MPNRMRDVELRGMILAILENRPSYGYQIVQLANEKTEGYFEWREGTIYPLLHQLEKEKAVRADWRDADGRRRKYYLLTRKGARQLAAARKDWDDFVWAVNALLKGV
jgi:DNA-binding PadR family transcriptional regulator